LKKITIYILFILFLNLCYSCKVGSCVEFDNSDRVCVKNSIFLSPIIYMKEKLLETFLKEYIKRNVGINTEISLDLDNETSGNRYIVNNAVLSSELPQFKGFQLTDLKLNTVNPGIEIIKEDNKLIFPNDIPIHFSTKITNDNLNFLTSSEDFNVLIGTMMQKYSNFIHIKEIKIQIVDNKLKIQIIGKLQILFGMPVKITFYPLIELVDGKLYLKEIQSDKASAAYINKILPAVNNSQPLSSYIKILQNLDDSYKFENLTIENNEIFLDGMFIIPQNCDINK